ncbi:pyrophosphate--fructose 6-phosphate 1-phosphotransferase subunit alpha [Tanacetum coccineum]
MLLNNDYRKRSYTLFQLVKARALYWLHSTDYDPTCCGPRFLSQVLGHICYHMLSAGLNGNMATVTNLKDSLEHWRCGATPKPTSGVATGNGANGGGFGRG